MRIWHYELLPFLPNSLMIQLWEDLQRLYKGERDLFTKFIDNESEISFFNYSVRLAVLMDERKIVGYEKSRSVIMRFFEQTMGNKIDPKSVAMAPFPIEHDFFYLMYCGSILNEYFSLGLDDYSEELNDKLNYFLANLLANREKLESLEETEQYYKA